MNDGERPDGLHGRDVLFSASGAAPGDPASGTYGPEYLVGGTGNGEAYLDQPYPGPDGNDIAPDVSLSVDDGERAVSLRIPRDAIPGGRRSASDTVPFGLATKDRDEGGNYVSVSWQDAPVRKHLRTTDDRQLVSIANYAHRERTFEVAVNGEVPDRLGEWIEGRQIAGGRLTVGGLTPALVEIGGATGLRTDPRGPVEPTTPTATETTTVTPTDTSNPTTSTTSSATATTSTPTESQSRPGVRGTHRRRCGRWRGDRLARSPGRRRR